MSLPRLNRHLALQAPVRTADAMGGYAFEWQTIGTLWAEVAPGSGREVRRGEAALGRVPMKITVRMAPLGSDARPKAGQRFIDGPRIFTITAVTERDPAGAYLTCHADEEVVL